MATTPGSSPPRSDRSGSNTFADWDPITRRWVPRNPLGINSSGNAPSVPDSPEEANQNTADQFGADSQPNFPGSPAASRFQGSNSLLDAAASSLESDITNNNFGLQNEVDFRFKDAEGNEQTEKRSVFRILSDEARGQLDKSLQDRIQREEQDLIGAGLFRGGQLLTSRGEAVQDAGDQFTDFLNRLSVDEAQRFSDAKASTLGLASQVGGQQASLEVQADQLDLDAESLRLAFNTMMSDATIREKANEIAERAQAFGEKVTEAELTGMFTALGPGAFIGFTEALFASKGDPAYNAEYDIDKNGTIDRADMRQLSASGVETLQLRAFTASEEQREIDNTIRLAETTGFLPTVDVEGGFFFSTDEDGLFSGQATSAERRTQWEQKFAESDLTGVWTYKDPETGKDITVDTEAKKDRLFNQAMAISAASGVMPEVDDEGRFVFDFTTNEDGSLKTSVTTAAERDAAFQRKLDEANLTGVFDDAPTRDALNDAFNRAVVKAELTGEFGEPIYNEDGSPQLDDNGNLVFEEGTAPTLEKLDQIFNQTYAMAQLTGFVPGVNEDGQFTFSTDEDGEFNGVTTAAERDSVFNRLVTEAGVTGRWNTGEVDDKGNPIFEDTEAKLTRLFNEKVVEAELTGVFKSGEIGEDGKPVAGVDTEAKLTRLFNEAMQLAQVTGFVPAKNENGQYVFDIGEDGETTGVTTADEREAAFRRKLDESFVTGKFGDDATVQQIQQLWENAVVEAELTGVFSTQKLDDDGQPVYNDDGTPVMVTTDTQDALDRAWEKTLAEADALGYLDGVDDKGNPIRTPTLDSQIAAGRVRDPQDPDKFVDSPDKIKADAATTAAAAQEDAAYYSGLSDAVTNLLPILGELGIAGPLQDLIKDLIQGPFSNEPPGEDPFKLPPPGKRDPNDPGSNDPNKGGPPPGGRTNDPNNPSPRGGGGPTDGIPDSPVGNGLRSMVPSGSNAEDFIPDGKNSHGNWVFRNPNGSHITVTPDGNVSRLVNKKGILEKKTVINEAGESFTITKDQFLAGVRNQTLVRIGWDIINNGFGVNTVGKIPDHVNKAALATTLASSNMNPYLALAVQMGLDEFLNKFGNPDFVEPMRAAFQSGSLGEVSNEQLIGWRDGTVGGLGTGQAGWSFDGERSWRGISLGPMAKAIDMEITRRGFEQMEADGVVPGSSPEFDELMAHLGTREDVEGGEQGAWVMVSRLYMKHDGDMTAVVDELSTPNMSILDREGDGFMEKFGPTFDSGPPPGGEFDPSITSIEKQDLTRSNLDEKMGDLGLTDEQIASVTFLLDGQNGEFLMQQALQKHNGDPFKAGEQILADLGFGPEPVVEESGGGATTFDPTGGDPNQPPPGGDPNSPVSNVPGDWFTVANDTNTQQPALLAEDFTPEDSEKVIDNMGAVLQTWYGFSETEVSALIKSLRSNPLLRQTILERLAETGGNHIDTARVMAEEIKSIFGR